VLLNSGEFSYTQTWNYCHWDGGGVADGGTVDVFWRIEGERGRAGTGGRAAERLEPEPRASGDLLERVLQETLSATARGQPLEAAEMAALLDVARRHAEPP